MALPPPTPFFTLRSHTDYVTALCFVSSEDNVLLTETNEPALLSGSKDGKIFFWNLKNNRVQYELLGHKGKMILWLHVYGNHIISQGRDGCILFWHYQTNKWIVNDTYPSAEVGFCSASIFIRSSTPYLVIPDEARSDLNIVEYGTGTTVSKLKPDSHGMCMCVKVILDKNDAVLFCGYEDGFIIVWNFSNNRAISSFQCQKEPVFCLDVDIEHKHRGVNGAPEGALQIWNISDEFQLSSYQDISLTHPGVNAVAIRPDGKILILGGWDGSVRIFSWKTLKPLAVMFHQSSVLCLQFSREIISKHKSVFATGSKDGNISLWSVY